MPDTATFTTAASAAPERPSSLRVHQFHGLRPGPRLIVLGAVHGNEVAGPLAIGRALVFGGRFRYVGRARSLAEYRADLAPGVGARVKNALRQLAHLWRLAGRRNTRQKGL